MENHRERLISDEMAGRIRGCLLGAAIGDALGAPFELVRPGVKSQIEDFHPWNGNPPGTWTDDTGMSLATCRALIRHLRGGGRISDCLREAFRDWADSPDCRRPGHSVYHAAKYGTADRNSWGSGALMRMAPVGVYAFLRGLWPSEAARLAIHAARKTHGHPQATFPAVEFVLALTSIFAGEETVPADLARPWRFPENLEGEEMDRVEEYKGLRPLPFTACQPTSGLFMWKQVMEQCLGLKPGSPWNLLPDFQKGILRTVNESIDRDTAGAVAGGILGAYWGLKGIPGKWQSEVRLGEDIMSLADQLMGRKV